MNVAATFVTFSRIPRLRSLCICTLHSVLDGGDHSIFVGEVQDVVIGDEESVALEPLLYFAGSYRTVGPKP